MYCIYVYHQSRSASYPHQWAQPDPQVHRASTRCRSQRRSWSCSSRSSTARTRTSGSVWLSLSACHTWQCLTRCGARACLPCEEAQEECCTRHDCLWWWYQAGQQGHSILHSFVGNASSSYGPYVLQSHRFSFIHAQADMYGLVPHSLLLIPRHYLAIPPDPYLLFMILSSLILASDCGIPDELTATIQGEVPGPGTSQFKFAWIQPLIPSENWFWARPSWTEFVGNLPFSRLNLTPSRSNLENRFIVPRSYLCPSVLYCTVPTLLFLYTHIIIPWIYPCSAAISRYKCAD